MSPFRQPAPPPPAARLGAPAEATPPSRPQSPVPTMPNPLIVPDDAPCPENRTMAQGFEWYSPADNHHWNRLAKAIPNLAALGVDSMWIPPATKAAWPKGNGYDIYDLYDLGEFNQKGCTATKWGTKQELQHMVKTANAHGVRILFDAVLNHKASADFVEPAVGRRVDQKDRTQIIGGPEEIEVWTGFNFPGRGNTYSGLRWNKDHFTGIDYDHKHKVKALYKFEGKEWAEDTAPELGNYDYLMFADIDHKHPEVRRDLFHWVEWLASQLKLGGLRLDAIKHYSAAFLRDFVRHIDQTVGPDWFLVGEYWEADSRILAKYVEFMHHRISLFDVRLVQNFSRLSFPDDADLRTVFDETLTLYKPLNSVTFVVNHDTQDGQSLETPIAPWFIPLAYSLILLRANAGLPCVFYSDLYGSFGQHPKPDFSNFIPPISGGAVLPRMMQARKLWAYGTQVDYFDDPRCVGFTRLGHPSRSGGDGLAVVMTNAWEYRTKSMCVGRRHAGERWTDVLRWCPGTVTIDAEGFGVFPVAHRSVSVWVNEAAHGRDFVESFVFDHHIYLDRK